MEPKKISDVILEIDQKVDTISKHISSQDLTNKILSNKYTEVLKKLDEILVALSKQNQGQIKVEAIQTVAKPPIANFDPEKHTVVFADDTIPVEANPNGAQRRTSRNKGSSQNLSGDDAYREKITIKEPVSPYPIQVPKGDKAEIIVPQQQITNLPQVNQQNNMPAVVKSGSTVVSQIVRDKNGKAIFLADVNIIKHDTSETVYKGRTNSIGKWAAPLSAGNYRVSIKKMEPVTHTNVEAYQDINVPNGQKELVLEVLMFKDL